jgi:hypothetical protein
MQPRKKQSGERDESIQSFPDVGYDKLKDQLLLEDLIMNAINKALPKIAGQIIQAHDETQTPSGSLSRNTNPSSNIPSQPSGPSDLPAGNNSARNVKSHPLSIFKYLLSSCVDFAEQPIRIGVKTKPKNRNRKNF